MGKAPCKGKPPWFALGPAAQPLPLLATKLHSRERRKGASVCKVGDNQNALTATQYGSRYKQMLSQT